MIWQSELVLYGLMIGNAAVVALVFLVSWKKGYLEGYDNADDVLFAPEERKEQDNG